MTTIGCNNISHIIVPNYHVWGDRRRFSMFGGNTSKGSDVIFSSAIPDWPPSVRKKHKKVIKKFKVVNFERLRTKTLPSVRFNTHLSNQL